MGLGIFFFGEQLLSIYAPGEPEVIEYGMIRLTYLATTYFLCGIMEVGCGMLRGIGQSFVSMVISLTGACGLRVLWIYTVFAHWHSLPVLYLSYPISWILTLTADFVFFFVLKKRLVRHVQAIDDAQAAEAARSETENATV